MTSKTAKTRTVLATHVQGRTLDPKNEREPGGRPAGRVSTPKVREGSCAPPSLVRASELALSGALELPREFSVHAPGGLARFQTRRGRPLMDPEVLRGVLEPALLAVYAERASLPAGTKVVVATEVESDGWGDLQAQVWVGRLLQEAFPGAQIQLATLLPRERLKGLEVQVSPETRRALDLEVVPPDAISPEFARRLREADLVVEVASESRALGSLLAVEEGAPAEADARGPRYLHLSEYGVPGRRLASPQRGDARTLGLGGTELGLMARPALADVPEDDPKGLEGLEARTFRDHLIGGPERLGAPVMSADVERFWATHQLAFAYCSTPRSLAAFVLCQAKASESSRKPNLVVVTNLAPFLEEVGRSPKLSDERAVFSAFFDNALGGRAGRASLRSAGIREVHLRWTRGAELTEVTRSLGASERRGAPGRAARSRRLTIHAFDVLPNTDVHRLMGVSHFAIGCTGDGSLSEVLSAGRLPFYDPREHKLTVARGLTELARSGQAHAGLTEFFVQSERLLQLEEWDLLEPLERSFVESAGKLGELLQDPSLRPAARAFASTLVAERSARSRVPAAVGRAIAVKSSPELLEVEETVMKRWIAGQPLRASDLEPLRAALDARCSS